MSTPGVVGVIGAGALGSALIDLLVARSYKVKVFDPSPDARARAIEAGASCLEDAQSVFASDCPVITCVASREAFRSTIDAACEARKQGNHSKPIIEMSTMDPHLKEEARSRLAQVGTIMLDCPASGTSAQARKGELLVFTSGDATAVASCNEIFGAIARKTIHVGDFGTGIKLKLLANHLVAINSAAAGEAMMLARKMGLDLHTTLDALVDSAGRSRMLEVRGPQMIDRTYLPAPGSVNIIVKDGKMIQDLARQAQCTLPMLDRACGLYEELQVTGFGDHDVAVIHEFLMKDNPS